MKLSKTLVWTSSFVSANILHSNFLLYNKIFSETTKIFAIFESEQNYSNYMITMEYEFNYEMPDYVS